MFEDAKKEINEFKEAGHNIEEIYALKTQLETRKRDQFLAFL